MSRRNRRKNNVHAKAKAPGSVTDPVALGGGAFEGAKRMSREMAAWVVGNNSADRDMLPDKNMLEARSKNIYANDAYVDSGIEKYKDSVIGSLFRLNANPNIDYLRRRDKRLDEKWQEEFQEEVEALWELAAESNSAWLDCRRKKTATEMVRLSLATKLIQGESVISSEWITRTRRPFKTAFQIIDPTRIDDPGIIGMNDIPRNIRRGVRFNANDEPVGYFVATQHPHDYYPNFNSALDGKLYQYVPRETPWGRVNLHHNYEERRPGQSRGIAKMASALKEMKMTKSFRDVMLQNAIVNATYAAAIESELPNKEILEMLGGGDSEPDQFAKAIAGYTGGFLGSLSSYLSESNGTLLNGVKIPHLFPGTKLNLMPAAQGGPLGTDFEKSLLRYLAANFNMSYEQFSGDISEANYSTLKGAINETEKHMRVEKRMTAERDMNFMYTNWLEEQIVGGRITSMPVGAPIFWEDLNREAYSQADWLNSGRGQIEELKETQAAGLRLKGNLSTHETEMGRFGVDWRRAFRQKKREREFAAKMGIDLNFEDPSLNASTGTPRDKTPTDKAPKSKE